MQIHKLLRRRDVKFKVTAVTGAQQKYPWGVLAQAEFGATGRGCSPPSTVILSIAKPTQTARYTCLGRTCRPKLGRSWVSAKNRSRQRYNVTIAPEYIQTCTLCAGDAIDLASSTRNRTSLLPCFLYYSTSIPF
ncbi:hypothetical protein Zmor_018413 [Zophobas morio]|uniref:Uncharacterized protein n=1 Tax=Zophobas morio TaxID=2755281 RepID=A0AA38IEB6_9CUCU|nr:hypothetical protein Zmor_018413 [Zophobas morio]